MSISELLAGLKNEYFIGHEAETKAGSSSIANSSNIGHIIFHRKAAQAMSECPQDQHRKNRTDSLAEANIGRLPLTDFSFRDPKYSAAAPSERNEV